MKKHKSIILIGLIVMFAASCERIDEVEDAKQKLKETINRFYQAQEQQNFDAILSHYSQESETISLGPNFGDRYVGSGEIQQFWQQFFEYAREVKIWRRDEMVQINFEGNTAWISSVNRVEMKKESEWQTIRYFFTGVLEMDSGNWYFVQTHFSIPQGELLKSKEQVDEIEQPPQIELRETQPPQTENEKIVPPPVPAKIDTSQKTIVEDTVKTMLDSAKTKIDTTTEKK